ncbi:hypothetical protein [Hydrogenophaga sp. PAMC20947]|uniref:hypothetical protein n=1 Tax=Hydrogenophaga sp. PAMC20947 TaxID=2565558 RepID=UPI001FFAE508|nr:hypothetical protein [Hydrogenophaga sp. PAMC20947]
MALLALDRYVFARQRKCGLGVVKACALPVAIAVAGFAGLPKLTFVLVVFGMAAVAIQWRFSKTLQIFVARVTFHDTLSVCVSQREFRSIVVKAAFGGLPVAFAVTVPTLFAQRGFVFVVLLVASKARCGRIFEHRAVVAFFALDLHVFSCQWEAGFGVIELGWLFPTALGMAAPTILAQRVLVLVVALVAGVAVLTQLDLVKVAGMATAAFCRPMLATQKVFGVGVVVEVGRLPSLGAVARIAFFTVLSSMALATVIVLFVAPDASANRFLVIIVFVAIGALDIGMLSRQRKTCFLVVIKLGLLPARLRMAIGTLDAKAALVHIVLLVTAVAVQWRLTVFFARLMALHAVHFFMLAEQAVVGDGVVKSSFVELDNLGISPLVVGMAGVASLRLGSPMKTFARSHVSTYVFVA